MNDISFSSTIDDLNLCVRTVGVLRSSGIEQVADLVTLTPRKVKRLYGVGSRVLDEIERALDAHGFRLGMDVEPSATPSPLTFADVIGEHRDQFAEAERVRVAELRDHFAGLAMAQIIANGPEIRYSLVCESAYMYADAMVMAKDSIGRLRSAERLMFAINAISIQSGESPERIVDDLCNGGLADGIMARMLAINHVPEADFGNKAWAVNMARKEIEGNADFEAGAREAGQ